MGAKILKGIGLFIGGLVLSLLVFVVIYLIGYGLYAIFSRSGLQTSAARGTGAGIAAALALALLALYFLRRRRRVQEQRGGRHSGGRRAA